MIAVFQSQVNGEEHDWKWDAIYNKYVTLHFMPLVCNEIVNSADI